MAAAAGLAVVRWAHPDRYCSLLIRIPSVRRCAMSCCSTTTRSSVLDRPSSPAARQRRWRQRRRDGLVTYQLVLDEVDTAAMLVAGGLLNEPDADDHQKVTAALEQQIANLIALSRRYA